MEFYTFLNVLKIILYSFNLTTLFVDLETYSRVIRLISACLIITINACQIPMWIELEVSYLFPMLMSAFFLLEVIETSYDWGISSL